MIEDLKPMGPSDPNVRGYTTDIGIMVYMFGWLENLLIHYLGLSNRMTEILDPPLPRHDGFEKELEALTLGKLVRAFERRSSAPELAAELSRLNDDRIRDSPDEIDRKGW